MADGVAITAGLGTKVATDDAGSDGHVQMVKLAISADGSATRVPADVANGLDVDVTRIVDGADATQGAIADAAVAAGAAGSLSAKLRAISRDLVSNVVLAAGTALIGKVGLAGKVSATGDTEIDASTAGADGVSNTANTLRVSSHPSSFNGSTWDRRRNNYDVAVLASAARTAAVNSAVQTNFNNGGVIIVITVTAKAAATTLDVHLRANGTGVPITVGYVTGLPAAAGAAYGIMVHPGLLTPPSGVYMMNGVVPRSWHLTIFPSDANSVTYQVDAFYTT